MAPNTNPARRGPQFGWSERQKAELHKLWQKMDSDRERILGAIQQAAEQILGDSETFQLEVWVRQFEWAGVRFVVRHRGSRRAASQVIRIGTGGSTAIKCQRPNARELGEAGAVAGRIQELLPEYRVRLERWGPEQFDIVYSIKPYYSARICA